MAGKGKLFGVLALQGDFEKHQHSLESAGARQCEVRNLDDLKRVDALVIPGGESTTMLRLMDYYDLFEPLKAFGAEKPMFGTCAGAILMARGVSSPAQKSLDVMDIDVERNAYGRQVDSRIIEMESSIGNVEAVFIRAPIIRRTGSTVEVLASYLGDAVLVRQGKHLAATFHPELTDDTRVHKLFMDLVEE